MLRALQILTITALFAMLGTSVAAQTAEKFTYTVTWGYSDVATMKLQTGCPTKGYVPTALTAKSTGFAEQLHEFEVRLDSFANTDGETLEGRTFVNEEGVSRYFRTRFATDGPSKVVKKYKTKQSTLALTFRGSTHDLLSWSYALRNESLKTGASFSYYVWDGWKLATVRADVKKTERLWTPSGTYPAYRIELTRTRLHHAGDKAYQPKKAPNLLGTIWLAKKGHLPVGMDFDAPVGVAKIRLSQVHRSPCSPR